MLALLLVHMKENKSEILQNMSTSEVALPAEASWVLFLRQFLPHIAQLLRHLVSGFQTKIQRICNRQFSHGNTVEEVAGGPNSGL